MHDGSAKETKTTVPGIIITIVALVISGLGIYFVFTSRSAPQGAPGPQPSMTAAAPSADNPAGEVPKGLEGIVHARQEVPSLPPKGTYRPSGDTVDVQMSEYPGYAGLIVANGGLEPSEGSLLFKKHGIKLRIRVSEEDAWARLSAGTLGVWPNTVDSLALYGGQAGVVVPALIGFSRGADGIVVRSDIHRVNQLKGRTLVTSQFTVSEFFIRFLTTEAGVGVKLLSDPDAPRDPERVNLLFTGDAQKAGEEFVRDLQGGAARLDGCVTWAPYTDQVVQESQGKAAILATTSNLLVAADILVVNKGFAEENPKMVAGMVNGLLEGNRMVRDNPEQHADTIARAFGWQRADVAPRLARVHLANLPESLAFFSGDIDAAGSFGGIYQSAVMAYGSALIKKPASEEKLLDLRHLKALERSGAYKDQTILISPIKGRSSRSLEADPLLSKNIRFYFEPNSAKLDLSGEQRKANEENLAAIKRLLQTSPGSTVLLRGHVDDANVAEFQRLGGEALMNKMALAAIQLSKERSEEIRNLLEKKHRIQAKRVEIHGAGWSEPMSKTDPELNRRVEVHWFTLE